MLRLGLARQVLIVRSCHSYGYLDLEKEKKARESLPIVTEIQERQSLT